jgi:hypothetical protein
VYSVLFPFHVVPASDMFPFQFKKKMLKNIVAVSLSYCVRIVAVSLFLAAPENLSQTTYPLDRYDSNTIPHPLKGNYR